MAKMLGIHLGTTNSSLRAAGKMVGCLSKDLIPHAREETHGQT